MTQKTKREFDLDEWRREAPARCLRQAAKSYLSTALQAYIDIEAHISIWSEERFGTSAVVVCSLSRAIEHLLKLRLFKVDPLLLYPLPKKIEEYCQIRGIQIRGGQSPTERREERGILAHTVSFKEALKRVQLTLPDIDLEFKHFNDVYALRNSLEHHWDRNEEFLKKVVGNMSSKTIPLLRRFVTDVLQEEPESFFDLELVAEVHRLERAIEQGHSLELQRRLEEHRKQYAESPEHCRQKRPYPDRYEGLADEETDAKCPVCGEAFIALWDWEAEYDVEGTSEGYEGYVSGVFPDPKCLYCPQCHFYVESRDVAAYLPGGLEIEFEPECDEY